MSGAAIQNESRGEVLNINWPQALQKRFKLIVFDWDGTAVPDRSTRVPGLIRAMESVLGSQTLCAIVTGTKIEHLERQCLGALSEEARRNVVVCTNRGSEVFAYSPGGSLKRLYLRSATSAEEEALSKAAQELRNLLKEKGLDTEIISQRLNRRKIDLIPEPRWRDPKKAEFPELLQAVSHRLARSGIKGGISEVIGLSALTAKSAGLRAAKITSDIKHVEIGLTDKADSVRWIYDHVILGLGISLSDAVFFGDEFGKVGGLLGSDSLMRITPLEDSVFVSVGKEPEGVPEGILPLGGGPDRFVEFLKSQAERDIPLSSWGGEMPLPTPAPSWTVEQQGIELSREREMETLFSIGNGRLAVRGGFSIPAPISQSDLFLAGIYSRKVQTLPYSEIEFKADDRTNHPFTELVPFPFPFRLSLKINGIYLGLAGDPSPEYRRILDMNRGVVFETALFQNEEGKRTELKSLRLASFSDMNLLWHEVEVRCLNHSGLLEIDTSMLPPDFSLQHPHLEIRGGESPPHLSEQFHFVTLASGFEVAIGAKQECNGKEQESPHYSVRLKQGEPLRIRRILSVFTSREASAPLLAMQKHLQERSFAHRQHYLLEHYAQWDAFWDRADVRFPGAPEVTQAERFNLFHLRLPADHDPKVSVGAKTLTGRAYEGHIFWDAEVFTLPVYLYSSPDIAKHLLLYRYHTLDGARRRAREMGMRGACYAWESTVTGDDVTPRKIIIEGSKEEIPIFTGEEQIHVTADIAYAVWKYFDVTEDADFLATWGAEILIETARFWESRVAERNGTFHIDKVVGPDEYHHSVNDNAFTNWMARLNLRKAAWAVDWLNAKRVQKELLERLDFNPDEVGRWRDLARRLYFPTPDRTGVIEQFSGFFDLKPVELSQGGRFKTPISTLFNWREVNQRRLCKQADVLMIPFLFPEAWDQKTLATNFNYYEPITDHGSSLSPAVHAALAARLGLLEKASEYWEKSLFMDLRNIMGNTGLGFHAANAAGLWQALMFHWLGLGFNGGELKASPNPALPTGLENIEFQLFYRGKCWPYSYSRKERMK